MGRNKMENEFSGKLAAREIQPSAAAWDRLDAMLSTTEARQKPKRSYWMFIAAAIVIVALFSSVFLMQHDSITPEAESTGVASSEEKQQPATIDSVAPEEKLAQAPGKITPVVENPTPQRRSTHREMEQQPLLASVPTRELPVAEPSVQKTTQISNDDRLPESLLAAIRAKTDAQKKAVVKVDAKSLLDGVDEKRETSSSNKFLRSVGKGYQTVKVAVVNRNFEENH